MYTHKTKSSNHKAVANKIVQRRGGQTVSKAFVDRRSSNESQRALQRAMVYQPTIQMNKNLNGIIYYGYGKARKDYMEKNNLIRSDAHCTVDDLNRAIGLSIESMQGTMGMKRKKIKEATANDSRNLSPDEKDWASWLRERIDILRMPQMTGEQCRIDTKLIPLIERQQSKQQKISNGRSYGRYLHWVEEDHNFNVHKNIGKTQTNLDWNSNLIEKHNQFIENEDASKFNEKKERLTSLIIKDKDKDKDTVLDRTLMWLSGDVMHRFWRLTSLMGMDFFIAQGKRIVFVREEYPDPHSGTDGRKPITDSEWEHAIDLKYIKHGFVKRVDPINQTLYQRLDQERKWKRNRKRRQKRSWKQKLARY